MKIYPVIKRISFFDTPASTWSPGFHSSPFRIASASLSSSSVCRARLSGLRAVFCIGAFLHNQIFCRLAQRQVDIQLISQTLRKVTAQQSDNLLHMGFIKSVEYDSPRQYGSGIPDGKSSSLHPLHSASSAYNRLPDLPLWQIPVSSAPRSPSRRHLKS